MSFFRGFLLLLDRDAASPVSTQSKFPSFLAPGVEGRKRDEWEDLAADKHCPSGHLLEQ